MHNMSAWAIRNPIPPIVLFFMLTVLGVAGFMNMDIKQLPDVSFQAANVIVSQPGAVPTEMETQITQRVESAIASFGTVHTQQRVAAGKRGAIRYKPVGSLSVKRQK